MPIQKTIQIKLNLNNSTLTLAIIPTTDPITIGLYYKHRNQEGNSYHHRPLNPKYLQKSIEKALTDPEIATAVLHAAQQLLDIAQATKPPDQLAYNPEIEAEYSAWQDVVNEFKLIGEDINNIKFDILIKTIQLWAEHLVALRQKQTTITCAKATKCTNEIY